MIILISVFLLFIIFLEFFNWKQKKKYQQLFLSVSLLNNILETFKVLSYVPISKRVIMRDDIADVVSAFFSQNSFSSLSLIINQSKQVWRYVKNTQRLNQGITLTKDPNPNDLEKSLLAGGKGGFVVPLKNTFADYGFVLVISQDGTSEYEKYLLNVLGGVLTLTLAKWDLNSRLLLDAQIKAVSVIW